MGIVKVLLTAKLKILAAILFDMRKKNLLRNLSTVFLLCMLLVASYLFFHNLIFRYIVTIEDIGFLLIDRLVTIGFLIFFFMLIVSSFVFSFASLFRSRETEYLFSAPVTVSELFTSKYFDIVVFSSWTILIMALPILYSYAKVRDFGTLEYALTGIIVLLPFMLIATSLGTLLAILAKFASKYISLKVLILLALAGFAGFVYMVIQFAQPTQLKIQFTEDFRALNLFINNFQLNSNPFIPNFWFIQCLRALVLHDYSRLLLYVSALITTAGLFLTLLYVFVEKFYFTTWLSSLEQTVSDTSGQAVTLRSRKGFFSEPTNNQNFALLSKDILIFLREPGQWAQLLLILAILALYFINLSFIPEDIEIEQWRTILFIMNFGFCGFVLATMAVRFVYPSISLEGDSFWVLGSSPLSAATLLREKFLSSFIAFFIFAESVGLISSGLLQIEGLYRLLTFAGIFLMSITLSCLAVGFGAAFPDFSEKNPSKIVSSPGGILTVVVSLIYISSMIAMLSIPAYKYTSYLVTGSSFPMNELIVSIAVVIVINIVLIVLPLQLGIKSFTRREF